MMVVLYTVYVVILVLMIALVLLQRSEGGAFGFGRSSSGSYLTPRSSAGLLNKATMILGIAFMLMSILLVVMTGVSNNSSTNVAKQLNSTTNNKSNTTKPLKSSNQVPLSN